MPLAWAGEHESSQAIEMNGFRLQVAGLPSQAAKRSIRTRERRLAHASLPV